MTMKTTPSVWTFISWFSLLVAVEATTGNDSSTFSPEELVFLRIPNATTARESLKILTQSPHVAGTAGDREMAEFVQKQFILSGIPQVIIDNIEVRLNYPDFENPSSLSLWETTNTGESSEIHIDTKYLRRKEDPLPKVQENNRNQGGSRKRKLIFEAKLSEDILDPDIDETTDNPWRNHTFHGYSPSGNISNTKFVYANYGRPQDFKVLEDVGISVLGKIVLVRYGRCFRGLKVRNAQTRGAVGVLIYSDPADDGYSVGDVYPEGPWRSSSSVQRGSVQFVSQCAGDPYRADPRYRHVLNTTVHELCNTKNPKGELVPSIPSLPISYGDAIPLLQNLGGPIAGEIPSAVANDFIGGLIKPGHGNNSTVIYRLGPSKGYLDLSVRNTEHTTKIPNVVGVIPGSLPPEQDQPVLLGNHRDAWVFGAADPNSGTSTLIELARGFGTLYREHNWRPLRSIYLLSWSGEEYGLLGSTGWAELNINHSVPLQRSLAYLNTDTVVSGENLHVSASPSLIPLWKQVVEDLRTNGTPSSADECLVSNLTQICMARRYLENITVRDTNTNWEVPMDGFGDPKIGTLGSGSDYTVFLDHFGIPSLDFSYKNQRGSYGQYHSIYDSFAWMDKFGGNSVTGGGTSFDLMAFAAKIWGLLALRLADALIVPIDQVAMGRALSQYTLHIQDVLGNVTSINFDVVNLTSATDLFVKNAATIQSKCTSFSEVSYILNHNNQSDIVDEDVMLLCNQKLGLTERHFLLKEGLPGRPWFRHCLQAPGLDLGYAAETFPGIQQGLENKDWAITQEQIYLAAERINAAAESLF